MRQHHVIVVGIVLLSAGVAVAQEVDGMQVFPVVARTAGVGNSQWVTDLTVNNLLGEAVTVGIQFFPENQANTFDPSYPTRFPLGPRETRIIEDVLSEIFGYDSNIKGALVLSVEPDTIGGNPEEAKIIAVTRTYNTADPAGTYGQTVPSLEAVTFSAIPLVVTGARNDGQFRSNVGMLSQSVSTEIQVHYRILGPDGEQLTSGSRTLPPVSLRQFSLDQLGVGMVEGGLTVEMWLDEDSVSDDPCANFANRLMAYVSKVDNGTGDAEFLYAAPVEDFDCPN